MDRWTPADLPASTPFTANDLRQRLERRKRELAEAAQRNGNGHGETEERRRRFLSRRLMARDLERFVKLVEDAIAQGRAECRVLQFPSSWTTDRGRAINCGEPDWHLTLVGFAAEVYGYFVRELEPKGFATRAQIITWPDGIPGDVGVFIGW